MQIFWLDYYCQWHQCLKSLMSGDSQSHFMITWDIILTYSSFKDWTGISIRFRFLSYTHKQTQTCTHTLTFVLSTVYTRHLKQWLYCIFLHNRQSFVYFNNCNCSSSFYCRLYYIIYINIYIFMTDRPGWKFWIYELFYVQYCVNNFSNKTRCVFISWNVTGGFSYM